jgi:glycerol-1-phosphate dehydrogenase [NAD(P)+]
MRAADPIELLLEGRYPDPETGELLRAESRSVVIADSLDGRERELVEALDIGRTFAVICDTNTYDVLGRRVCAALDAPPTILGHPHADIETVQRVVASLPPVDAIITVGSGTLNDLSKMVAFERKIPQLVFATAPSMNGYTSVSASITSDGLKRSYRVNTPVAAFFDLGVLAAAPARLIRAGLGDSVCRPTAQADWLLSHLLLDREYREVPFALLAPDEAVLLAQAPALLGGDLTAMRHLARTLVLSGFGMTLAGGSFPASQGEHLISHYLEMMAPHDQPIGYHGEQIGVCTLEMARLQQRILERERAPVLRPSMLTRADLVAHYGPTIGEGCWREYEGKRFNVARTAELNDRLATQWDSIRTRISRVTVRADRIERVLASADAARTPDALGIPEPLFAAARTHAREIRNRYTFLDVEADAAG